MSAAPPVLAAGKLSKWYGNILGISDITLEIRGGIKGLLGPNGAGKSTLLKLASGQLKPSLGSLRVFGEPIFGNAPLFHRVGFCPEYDSFYGDLSGRQFIAFLGRLHRFAGAELQAAVDRALQTVGLEDKADRAVKGYSFGMRQRLRLAASLVHDPELLMLDEPLRGVDPLWRIRIIKLIKDLAQAGKTVIVSSHILPEIEAMTPDIILIHQGKIFAEGDLHYIRGLIDSHPHQIYVRSRQPRRLAEALIGREFVTGVDVDERGGVILRTSQRDHFYEALLHLIVEERLEVDEISSPDDNLQAVFDYLIGR